MSDYTLEWHGEDAKQHIRRKIVRLLHRAAITVKNRAKELLSVAGTGVAEPRETRGKRSFSRGASGDGKMVRKAAGWRPGGKKRRRKK